MGERDQVSKGDRTAGTGSYDHEATARQASDTDRRCQGETTAKRDERKSSQQGTVGTTRRSYLAMVGSVASVMAVPAARAASGNDYGEGGYGAETYGGVS